MNEDTMDEICMLVGDGVSLREIGTMGNMPTYREIRRALMNDVDFQMKLQMQLAAKMLCHATELEHVARDGGSLSSGDVQRDKLVIQTMQWSMERLAKDIFSTRQTLQVSDNRDAEKIEQARLAGELLERKRLATLAIEAEPVESNVTRLHKPEGDSIGEGIKTSQRPFCEPEQTKTPPLPCGNGGATKKGSP